MRFIPLLFIATTLPLFAAPTPREAVEADKLRAIFGQPVDADHDCDFSFASGRLRIRSPAAVHNLGGFGVWGNAPRTTREVIGDFTVSVNVLVPAPGGQSNPLQPPWLSGGLVVFGNAPTGPRRGIVGWVRKFDGDGWKSTVTVSTSRNEEQGGDALIGDDSLADGEQRPVSIAFTRIKETFQADYRIGDGKWKSLVAGPSALPEKLILGVYLENTTGNAATITFEDFTVGHAVAKE